MKLKIIFTKHALNRLKIRKIKKSDVFQILRSKKTKFLIDFKSGYQIALSFQKNKKPPYTVIVFQKENDSLKVITIYRCTKNEIKRKIKKRWF